MAFPTYPINGQTTVLNGISYTYSSATNSWARNSASSLVVTVPTANAVSYLASTTPPASGNLPGSLWYNTLTDIIYEYTFDGLNYVWVDKSSSTLNLTTGVTTYSANNTTVVSGTLVLNNASIQAIPGNLTVTGNLNTVTGANIGGNVLFSGNTVFSGATVSGNVTVSGNLVVTGNLIGNAVNSNFANCVVTSIPYSASAVGYIGIPQNSQSASYSVQLTDMGKQIYVTASGQTITIPANSALPLPIGSTFVVTTAPGVTTSIAITTDTMYLMGTSGTTGTRSLAAYGSATLIKVAATTWYISGMGLT
jgi:hypothetical protein